MAFSSAHEVKKRKSARLRAAQDNVEVQNEGARVAEVGQPKIS
jgi:hypothetical protein